MPNPVAIRGLYSERGLSSLLRMRQSFAVACILWNPGGKLVRQFFGALRGLSCLIALCSIAACATQKTPAPQTYAQPSEPAGAAQNASIAGVYDDLGWWKVSRYVCVGGIDGAIVQERYTSACVNAVPVAAGPHHVTLLYHDDYFSGEVSVTLQAETGHIYQAAYSFDKKVFEAADIEIWVEDKTSGKVVAEKQRAEITGTAEFIVPVFIK